MGFESMRGTHGRCPPLLVGGLLVVSFILTCNWWSSSTQNIELLKQLDEFTEQLKRCNDEKDQSIQLRLSVEGRLKSTEEELAQLRVRLEQQDINADDTKKSLLEKDREIKTLKKDLDNSKSSAKLCSTELESLKKVSQSQEEVIKSLKIEKDEMLAQKDDKGKDVDRLKKEVEKVTIELNNLKASLPPGGAVNAAAPNLAVKVRSKMMGYDSRVSHVEVSNPGLKGSRYHGVPILPRDPPNAFRPQPRFSVTMLNAKQVKSAASGVNSKTKAAAFNADEKDEDNAKEREGTIRNKKFKLPEDPVNNNEAVDAADDERFDNKGTNDEVDNNLPDENPVEDSVDQMAQAIQQENNNGAGGVAIPPVPSKS